MEIAEDWFEKMDLFEKILTEICRFAIIESKQFVHIYNMIGSKKCSANEEWQNEKGMQLKLQQPPLL